MTMNKDDTNGVMKYFFDGEEIEKDNEEEE